MVYKALVRPWFFRSDPEAVHERALHLAAPLDHCRIAPDINRGLLQLLEHDGFGSMVETVGTE